MAIGTSNGEYFATEEDYLASKYRTAKYFPKPSTPEDEVLKFEDHYYGQVVAPELQMQEDMAHWLKRFRERYDEVKKSGDIEHMRELDRHIMDIYDEITKGREPIKFPEPESSLIKS